MIGRVATSRWRGRLGLAVASTLISLVLAEVATRLLLPRPGFEPIPASPSIVADPILGYAYAPNYGHVTNTQAVTL